MGANAMTALWHAKRRHARRDELAFISQRRVQFNPAMDEALNNAPFQDELSRIADQWQAAAEIAVLKRRTRLSAFLGVGFGSLLVVLGGVSLLAPGADASGVVPLAIGALFAFEGTWTLRQLTPGVFLLSAFTSVLVGLWFLYPVLFLGESLTLMPIFGAALLLMGYFHVNRYLSLQQLWQRQPTEDRAMAVAKRVEGLQSGAWSRPEMIIEFTVEANKLSWHGDLSEPIGILLQPLTGRVACVSPRQFRILDEPGGITVFLIRGQRFEGAISTHSKAVYEQWRAAHGSAPDSGTDPRASAIGS